MAATTKTPAAKAAPTPRRKAASTGNQERPAKPEFFLNEAEGILHYSPDGVRDIAVTVDPPWSEIEPLISAQTDDTPQAELFTSVLEIIYGPDRTRELIMGLRTSQFFTLVYRWMDEFQKMMGIESPGE